MRQAILSLFSPTRHQSRGSRPMPIRFGCCGRATPGIRKNPIGGPEATRLARDAIVGYLGGRRGRKSEIEFSEGLPKDWRPHASLLGDDINKKALQPTRCVWVSYAGLRFASA